MSKERFLGFHSHPHPESPDGMLAEYLGSKDSKKDAMLRAVRSYWLSLALEDAGVRGRELEKVGFEAVLDLIKQAHYICAVLNLDCAQLGLGFPAIASPTAPAPVPSELESKDKLKGEEQEQELTDWDKVIKGYKYEDLGFDNWPQN
ncbi:MAG: hypothetical protein SVX43_08835 [Cyanobacteriota bacterium]|nr:hypothetical protein [Cyanobacteriota bacterium]